ncbi:hypothetical protein [Pedobacter changchengzhani]|nr:hypothetical protein [Pedobacter changchengzhani]
MKNLLFMMAILGLGSCTQTVKEKVKVSDLKDTATVLSPGIEPQTDNNREKIISEIKKFRSAMTTKNKTEILSFFDFPLADSMVNFFEVDSLFDRKRKTNGGEITKEMFSGSFNRIYEMTDMLEFNNLFADVNLGLLRNQDQIKNEKRPPNDGCYYIYIIAIKNDLVYFQYGTNSSDEYRKTHPDEEEVCDEYAQMWTFIFDGEKLKFLTHRIAG